MARFIGVLAAVLVAVSPLGAAAEIKQRGGSTYNVRIGPWYMVRQTYEDGASVCWGTNLSYRRSEPAFSYFAAEGGDHPGFTIRFDSQRPAPANDTATLIVGDERITLIHPPDWAPTAYGVPSVDDIFRINSLIIARQSAASKEFWVIESSGKKHRYDARQTTKMLAFLKEHCAGAFR